MDEPVRRRFLGLTWEQWIFAFAATVGISGGVLGWISWYRGEARTSTAEQQQSVQETYSSYLELDRLLIEHPELAHEFVEPDEYCDEIARVYPGYATAKSDEKARLRLREEAAAFYAMSAFARLIKDEQAPGLKNEARRKFLHDEMAYFTEDVLLNPRLVYFWREDKGYKYFDESTRAAFRELSKRRLKSDACGPFLDPTAAKQCRSESSLPIDCPVIFQGRNLPGSGALR